jgi:hypothetical protein
LRNLVGFLKRPSLERIQVLLKLKQDPFDSYQWLNQLHTQYHLDPIYFFLVAAKNKGYDKNILPHHAAMKSLIETHGKKYQLGVHPSALSHWLAGRREIPAEQARRIERLSRGKVKVDAWSYVTTKTEP